MGDRGQGTGRVLQQRVLFLSQYAPVSRCRANRVETIGETDAGILRTVHLMNNI